MVKEHLQVFARVKPLEKQNRTISNLERWNVLKNKIGVQICKGKMSYTKEYQEFGFDQVFAEDAKQEQLFQRVAKPVIDNCLEGYNGTIFTYGQTGSGKTFTINGGQTWKDRGITPRVLTYIFQQFEERSKQYAYQLEVSFIQIYNQNAYDLLDKKHSQTSFETWSKITFLEDEDSNLQMKNVKAHLCQTAQQCLQFLMMGNYIKKISSTNLNQTSSRSHCIFTLNVRGKNLSNLNQIYSKIHLVDLAGSQRVSKSQAEGQLLAQAKCINLSLTYLQQVIVALNQKKAKGKNHIPYRNSLLTTLLKDSLGGNCKTVMIATISIDPSNIDESVSTLRFSQRVKQIQNEVAKNEMNIYSSRIEQLQKENLTLKRKLALLERQQRILQPKSMNSFIQNQEITSKKIQEFMSEKRSQLEIQSLGQAQFYLQKIRENYTRKMRQYASQLTFISEKLAKYDQFLSRRERKQNLDIFNV